MNVDLKKLAERMVEYPDSVAFDSHEVEFARVYLASEKLAETVKAHANDDENLDRFYALSDALKAYEEAAK